MTPPLRLPSAGVRFPDVEPAISGPSSTMRNWAFPALVVSLVLVLGLLGFHGSSMAEYATYAGLSEENAGLLDGPTRSIRTDEWNVRTPWVLRQAELGLPSTAAGGVGTHDTAVLGDLPVASWELILRPHTAWYLVFGAGRSFSLEWWSLFAVQLLGVFSLLLVVTKRPLIAALSAMMLTLSPATQWWSAPGTFTTIGYGSGAMACLLLAHGATSWRRRAVFAVISGYLLAAFMTTLYVPWQVGTALVVVPVGGASLLPSILDREERPAAIRRLLIVGGISLGVAGALFGSFLVVHREAISTIASTVYPGRNAVSRGGQIQLPVVWSATFDYFASQKPSAMVNGTNQSENSSALMLILPVGLICLLLVVAGRFRRHPAAFPLLGCLVGGAVMVSWMLLPIPGWIGQFALLTRVTPMRLCLPLGFAGVVALALLVHYHAASGRQVARFAVYTSAGLFAAAQAWAALVYTVDGRTINFGIAMAFVGVVTAGFILAMGRRPAIGFGVLALFTLWQASMIHPIQRGIDPLTATPLRRAIDTLRAQDQGGAWVAFSADRAVKGTLTASGANHLSGVSPFPDREAWAVLDPESDDETDWNRYAHVSFIAGSPAQATKVELVWADDLTITIDPCSPLLDELDVGFMVSQGFELHTCVRPVARVPHGATFVAIYKRQPNVVPS